MYKSKALTFILAAFGLIVAAGLLYGAIKFYRTIRQITKNNPSLVPQKDTLRIITDSDTLLDINASLNQQIAEQLNTNRDEEKNKKQILLHSSIIDFIYTVDTLEKTRMDRAETIKRLKNAVNRTNMACRSSLFDIKDLEKVEELNTFMILDENKMENTIFECFLPKEIKTQCFELIKHQALLLESKILEKNFKQLKT